MQNLIVAIVQAKLFWEDKQANFNHFETGFFSKMQPGEADLVILPEMFNSGFSMNVQGLAERMDGPSVNWLITQSAKLNCQIGGSLIIEEEGKFFNRFVITSKKGIESFYDKRHLFRMANENNYFNAGAKRVIHELKGWKILLQVCYDLRFPVFSRNRNINGKKEYDALIYTANWPEKRSFIWKNLIQARAIENQVYVLGINRVGVDGNEINYSGDSCAIDPWGNVVLNCGSNSESIQFVQLLANEMEKIKTSFPAFLDADDFENFL